MTTIFNKSQSPSFFGHTNFRVSYTLLPAIREITLNAQKEGRLNVVSIACGTALELSCFEMLSRARNIKINYLGFDINKQDLKFNAKVLKKRTPCVEQQYYVADLATSPPVDALNHADCIIWRHPEFLSDHDATPKDLGFKMAQILMNIIRNKNPLSPILITCYDPHEMILVLELTKLLCNNELEFSLHIDQQPGRSSIDNPLVSQEDKDPLFNLNHHDQFQLTIYHCSITTEKISDSLLLKYVSIAFQNLIKTMPKSNTDKQQELIKQLDNADLELLRQATTFLNNEIRNNEHPLNKREELITILAQQGKSPALTHS